jgi:alpha-beta hydrolase superfamily lysophospholipase
MSHSEPFVTYLELRESNADGDAGAGLQHSSEGLVLLHVLELAAHGEPRGAVTIVHDAGEHGGRYVDLAHELASRGWSIALPDLRGHGRSEGERGHSNGIREVIRDIGDVQDHLAYRQPDAPKVLIGQGLGALYCLAYACERPDGVAALVLSGPLFEPRFQLPQCSGGLMKLFKKTGPTSPGRIGWAADALSSDSAEHARRGADTLVHDVITVRAGGQATAAASQYARELARLSMPVLVAQGADDSIAPVGTSRALVAGASELKVFEGLRHDLFHEARSAEVSSFVCDWLDRKLPR